MLLLHGFAGTWWVMRHQLEALAAAGYHAVAVDLRGHGDSDKPPRGYDSWTLAADVTNLIRALGHASAVIVGHGEGGFLAWTAAYRRPGAVDALAVLGSAHPHAFRSTALRSSAQRRMLMRAIAAYQPPRLPERALTRHGAEKVERLLRQGSGPDWPLTKDFTETSHHLRTAMLIPKVAHLTLESQRWMFRSQFRPDGAAFRRMTAGRLHHPVLALRGELDQFVLDDTVRRSSRWAPELDYVEVPGAGHFVTMEAPDETSRLLVDFVRRSHRPTE